MKKLVCFFAMISLGYGLFAFDRSLNGSWGLTQGNEKEEIIRFNTNEIIFNGELFRSGSYEEAENTIYFSDPEGGDVVIQYYLLSSKKLLFILWNVNDPTESLTLILSKL